MVEVNQFDCRLNFPMSMVVAGAAFAGKTFFVLDLIKKRDLVFKEKVQKVVYVYSHFQERFQEFSNDEQGSFLSHQEELETHLSPGSLLIYDDQMLNFERNAKSNFEIINWVIRRVTMKKSD